MVSAPYPAKYHHLIDPQVWDFIRETEKYYPPDAVELGVAEQRDVYDRLCRAYHQGIPSGVTASDGHVTADGRDIPVRRYTSDSGNDTAQSIYLHGGGFVVGGLDSHDDVCAEICAQTGFSITSVNYRLAPEHHFPEDFDDVLVVFSHLCAISQVPIIAVGDSAGGNLSAALCHATRDQSDRLIGQVLIYPGLNNTHTTGSAITHQDAPMLTTRDMAFYANLRVDGDLERLADPLCSPLNDSRFDGLPPTVIFGAECDPLCDDAEQYCDRINQAGGRARFNLDKGLVHGHLRARHQSDRARASFASIIDAITMIANRVWYAD